MIIMTQLRHICEGTEPIEYHCVGAWYREGIRWEAYNYIPKQGKRERRRNITNCPQCGVKLPSDWEQEIDE